MVQEVREPTVVVRGDVPDAMVAYARTKIAAVVKDASLAVLDFELRLDHHADPARERPNHVEVSIDLNGTWVHARCSASTMAEAIDGAQTRLRRRVETAREGPRARRLRRRDVESWHHGDGATRRLNGCQPPAEDRVLVRRKTFALRSESIEDALYDLELLDHDFFLFVHDETGAEAVVYRTGDGYGLVQRVATPEVIARVELPLDLGPDPVTRTVENALAALDETGASFQFFVDDATGHGEVAYRRDDGDYGLILPS